MIVKVVADSSSGFDMIRPPEVKRDQGRAGSREKFVQVNLRATRSYGKRVETRPSFVQDEWR